MRERILGQHREKRRLRQRDPGHRPWFRRHGWAARLADKGIIVERDLRATLSPTAGIFADVFAPGRAGQAVNARARRRSGRGRAIRGKEKGRAGEVCDVETERDGAGACGRSTDSLRAAWNDTSISWVRVWAGSMPRTILQTAMAFTERDQGGNRPRRRGPAHSRPGCCRRYRQHSPSLSAHAGSLGSAFSRLA